MFTRSFPRLFEDSLAHKRKRSLNGVQGEKYINGEREIDGGKCVIKIEREKEREREREKERLIDRESEREAYGKRDIGW